MRHGDIEPNDLILQTAVAITGATTATINRYHTLADSGGGDYTVTLPAAGTAGRRISFKALTGLTEIVTIDGNASETINGSANYKMAANDYLELEDNGTNWDIVSRKGLVFFSASSNAGQVVTANTEALDFEDDIIDVHQGWSGNNTFTFPRDGVYSVSLTYAATNSDAIVPLFYIDGAADKNGAHRYPGANRIGEAILIRKCTAGEALTIRLNTTSTRTTSATNNQLSITEVA
jgi:hypothetical protein